MKEASPRQIFDDQLLSIITTWSDVYDRMVSAGLKIPQRAFEWEDDAGYVCPELVTARMWDEMQHHLLSVARNLVSYAEDLGVISLDDWRTITHILWMAGTDEPIEEDYWE